MAWGLGWLGYGGPDSNSSLIFFRVFVTGERIGAPLLIALTLLLLLDAGGRTSKSRVDQPALDLPWAQVALLFVFVVLSGIVLGHVTGAQSSVSMDEFGAVYQATLFKHGSVWADVPKSLVEIRNAARPIFIAEIEGTTHWLSMYLPGYAVILAAWMHLGDWIPLNSFLNGCSAFVTAALGRKFWPKCSARQSAAAFSLAFGSQFLLAGGTDYSMPAHLLANLIWIYLHFFGKNWWWMAGPIGGLASLLHQPVPHPLFVLPFLVRTFREGPQARVVWYALWYAAAAVAFFKWATLTRASSGLIAFPTLANVAVGAMHVMLAAGWSMPLAPVALFVCLRRLRNAWERDLALGILLTLLFYLAFRLVTQGHGFGWRYGHPVLGSIALLVGSAWPSTMRQFGLDSSRVLYRACAAVLLVQLPWLAYTARQINLPFRNAHFALSSSSADIVVIPADSIWYGRDLVRNPPDFRPPVLLDRLAAPDSAKLARNGLKVERISVDSLVVLGLERVPKPRPR